jgi:hypothetical protein
VLGEVGEVGEVLGEGRVGGGRGGFRLRDSLLPAALARSEGSLVDRAGLARAYSLTSRSNPCGTPSCRVRRTSEPARKRSADEHFPSEAVETFQVLYDTLPEATGTAERLLEGFDAPLASPGEKATNAHLLSPCENGNERAGTNIQKQRQSSPAPYRHGPWRRRTLRRRRSAVPVAFDGLS